MGPRIVLQTRGQGKKPKKELNATKISNLTYTEFKVMVVKLHKKRKVDKLNETVRKGIEIIKTSQLEMQNTLTEMKNTLEEMNGRRH